MINRPKLIIFILQMTFQLQKEEIIIIFLVKLFSIWSRDFDGPYLKMIRIKYKDYYYISYQYFFSFFLFSLQ